MTKHVFLDTETTSLRTDRRVWDVGLIVREDKRDDKEFTFLVNAYDLDLGNADSFSLKIGNFWERHPFALGDLSQAGTYSEEDMLYEVMQLTQGAHIIGAVPNFDTEVLGARMRANNLLPTWHYHLIDIETLIIGKLAAEGIYFDLPWNSEELSRMIGVEPTGPGIRHTAIGDARWVRDQYDVVISS